MHMQIIIYARVSSGRQAEKELSIPAQLRALRQYAVEHNMNVVGTFQDTATGRSFKERAGLMAALRLVREDGNIKALAVHKVDRLARNMFEHLMLKRELQALNATIISVVEHFDASPMGDFIEHIMAAQAEFYSANLSIEVKKGLEERLQRGGWNGLPPIGYLRKDKKIIVDPARAPLILKAFALWATGNMTAKMVANMIYEQGLVSRNGNRIEGNHWCRILKDPFYIGRMRTRSGLYQGLHIPIVPKELFEQCQTVFKTKKQPGRGGISRKHLFLLSGLVRCPTCSRHLTGEIHIKKSGKQFRYYRCQHGQSCKYTVQAATLENQVLQDILAQNIPKKVLPQLMHAVAVEKILFAQRCTERMRTFRKQRIDLETSLGDLARRLSERKVGFNEYTREEAEIRHTMRVTEWLIACARHTSNEAAIKVKFAKTMKAKLLSLDTKEQRQVIAELVQEISVLGITPTIQLKQAWCELFSSRSNSLSADTNGIRTLVKINKKAK